MKYFFRLFRIVMPIYSNIHGKYPYEEYLFVDSNPLWFYWHSKMGLFSIVVYRKSKLLSELMSLPL